MTIRFLFLLLLIPALINAQDSISSQFIKDSLQIAKPGILRPQFRFDNRISFHEGQALSISGFDAGILMINKLRLTLGYYRMQNRLKSYDETIDDQEFGRIVHMDYGSLNTELIYKDTRFISWGMPLEIGAGQNTIQDKNITTGEVLSARTGGLLFVNFGLSGTYKPMRFLGLKVMVGYRKVAINQVKDFNYDGFFTSIGLNVDVRSVVVVVKMLRLKKKYHRGNRIANAVEIITQ